MCSSGNSRAIRTERGGGGSFVWGESICLPACLSVRLSVRPRLLYTIRPRHTFLLLILYFQHFRPNRMESSQNREFQRFHVLQTRASLYTFYRCCGIQSLLTTQSALRPTRPGRAYIPLAAAVASTSSSQPASRRSRSGRV